MIGFKWSRTGRGLGIKRKNMLTYGMNRNPSPPGDGTDRTRHPEGRKLGNLPQLFYYSSTNLIDRTALFLALLILHNRI